MQIWTSPQIDNHTNVPPLSFLQAGCPFCHPTNSIKALKAQALKPVPEETFTHTYHGHQSSLICFLHLLWSTASSLFNLRSWQSFFHNLSPSFLWSTSWAGTLHFILHAFLHLLLFAAHAHTIATCFAVVQWLCHLILVSLSALYLELYLVA